MSRFGLVRLTPMMGKALNVSRHTVVFAFAGRLALSCETRLSTYSSLSTMFTCQLKNTFTSALPRPVADRTCTTPGMSFIASSIGRVMVAIISSAGITPLSIRITHARKLRLRKHRRRHPQRASTSPPRHTASVMKMMASRCRMANAPTPEPPGAPVGFPAPSLISPLPPRLRMRTFVSFGSA